MTTRVLVAYGSRCGSTAQIAHAIGGELRAQGFDVAVKPVEWVESVTPYQVVVLGSALYAGRWRRAALRLLRREREALRARRVWLFQSGLSVTGPKPTEDPTPKAVAELADQIGVEHPVTFAGALLPSTARGLLPKLMARGRSAGDHRDWDAVGGWAREVAEAITKDAAHPRSSSSHV